MNCKDCLFYDFCNDYNEYPEYVQHFEQTTGKEFKCSHFKDKSRFVELPCKVGDTVYVIDNLNYSGCVRGGKMCSFLSYEYVDGYSCNKTWDGRKPNECSEIKSVVINDISDIFMYYKDFGKTVFTSLEEAKERMEEMSKNND